MTINDTIKVAQDLKAKIAELEDLLLADGRHFKCEVCGHIRKECDIGPCERDICEQCFDQSERRRVGDYD